ncbi:MAG: YegS/Rv2252/BmrU family lipid kinase [Clostridiales bacterium]|nr:YegS/Rv2252/BmrU family lipid kinase [Clostridiales bacterium]
MKKMLFIMNPCSGQKRANRFLPEILSTFNEAGYDVLVHMTAGPGDGDKTVCRLGAGMDAVVCCGGDGTFNDVVSGLLHSGLDVPVGYIPAGTTNDFANSLKLPTDVMEATRAIVDGTPVAYDAGKFGDRYFSYVASFGAFTRASYATPQNIKNALGHTAYVLEGIQELSQLRKEHVRMDIGGRIVEDDFLFGAISNSTSVGGILTLDPSQVDMRDGLLEVLLVRAPRNLGELTECIQALKSQKYNCEMITFCSAPRVTVYSDPDMPWTLDGEREEGHGEVVVENQHLAVKLLQKLG